MTSTNGAMRLVLHLDPDTSSVGEARRRIDAWMAERGGATELRDRVALVVSELVTNAIEASRDGVELCADRDARTGSVQVQVSNRAPAGAVPDRRDWGPDSLMAERGRGLAIVEALSESVSVDHLADTVVVTATLAPRPGAGR